MICLKPPIDDKIIKTTPSTIHTCYIRISLLDFLFEEILRIYLVESFESTLI